jgi:hypothetical protein
MGWQFAGFYRSYHTRYRMVSGRAYDSTAFSGAAGLIIAHAPPPGLPVYLPLNYYDVGAKWRFYTMKANREDLWTQTRYYADAASLNDATGGAIALLPTAEPTAAAPAGWSAIGRVEDLGGETTSIVIQKQ